MKTELYEKAVKSVLDNQNGSASFIQRSLGVHFNYACELLEQMELDLIVGAFSGFKEREVLFKSYDEYKLSISGK